LREKGACGNGVVSRRWLLGDIGSRVLGLCHCSVFAEIEKLGRCIKLF
jgi:hypothetical protein